MGFFGLSQILGVFLGPLLCGILLDAFPTDPRCIWGTRLSSIRGCGGVPVVGRGLPGKQHQSG